MAQSQSPVIIAAQAPFWTMNESWLESPRTAGHDHPGTAQLERPSRVREERVAHPVAERTQVGLGQAPRLGDVLGGPEEGLAFGRPRDGLERRPFRDQEIGKDVDEVVPLSRLEELVRNHDGPSVVAVEVVRSGELASDRRDRRLGPQVGVLRVRSFEERERHIAVARTEHLPAEGCGRPRRACSVSPLPIELDRAAEQPLRAVVAPAAAAASPARSSKSALSAGSDVTVSACSRNPRPGRASPSAAARSAAARRAIRAWAASASASGPSGLFA